MNKISLSFRNNPSPTRVVGAIKAVSISPNSKYFASASYDKTVRIYVTRDASLLHVLSGKTQAYLLVSTVSSYQLMSMARHVILQDIQKVCSVCLAGHMKSVECLSCRAYKKYVVFVLQDILKVCCVCLAGHTKSVECLAFSFDSTSLCSGSWDKTAILWNVQVTHSNC